MAVNSITFGGVNSADFGIYISGEGVFNAPKRDVEMIKIPGRNGEFALDNGRFENIEVTYPAFNFEPDDYDTFMQNLSDFRNAICSQRGYQRLTDTFHPDEYRMATYIGGLEIKPVKYNTASEFNIVFDCKPQRWLTSGETAVTIGEWGETETVSGDIVSVENPNGILAVKSLEVDLEPIQSGSGTPSPTNVRPISGHDSVDTNRTGINIWDEEWELGRLDFNKDSPTWGQNIDTGNQIRSTNYVSVKPSTSYYCKSGTASTIYAIFYDAEKHPVMATANDGYVQIANRAFTTPSDAHYIRFYCTNTTTYNNDISINYPSTDTSYHAYEGDTYTTALGTTVYGGTLDVTTGTLTVDRAIVTYNGSEGWSWSSGSLRPNITVSGIKQYGEVQTNLYPYTSSSTKVEGTITTNGGGGYNIWVCDSVNAPDLATWKTYLGTHNLQVVYELATPTTTTLTAQQIDLLTGNNNIWSDSGDITLEYGQNPSVLFNPTLFESGPLLEAAGSGAIQFNGYEIDFAGVPYGEVVIGDKSTWILGEIPLTVTLDTSLLNTGDPIYPALRDCEIRTKLVATYGEFVYVEIISSTNVLDAYGQVKNNVSPREFWTHLLPDFGDGFVYGTAKTITCSAVFHYTYRVGPTPGYWRETVQVTIAYDGADSYTVTVQSSGNLNSNVTRSMEVFEAPIMYGDSSQIITDPISIDCDLGEAYIVKNGEYISLNSYIDLGSELPKLASGSNTITFDNTITQLKVTPRWWKV